MNRKALILAAGGVLTIALVGTALGANAGETPSAGDDPARSAATASTNPTSPADDLSPSPSDDSSTRPSDDSSTRPSDDSSATPTESATATATATATRPSPDRTASTSGTIGRDRAIEIARSHAGGGQLVKVESEQEHGRQVWSVRLVKDGDRVRVDVDAATGQITRTEQKSDDN